MKEKLIPNLPPHSAVVLDNASYHNVKLNKVPNSNTTKTQMKEWLQQETIPFSDNMLKPTLYALIKHFKPNKVQYSINLILEASGHTSLHSPPYHPEFNPTKGIWATAKSWVASWNFPVRHKMLRWLCKEMFRSMAKED
jgi:hypothetical protein